MEDFYFYLCVPAGVFEAHRQITRRKPPRELYLTSLLLWIGIIVVIFILATLLYVDSAHASSAPLVQEGRGTLVEACPYHEGYRTCAFANGQPWAMRSFAPRDRYFRRKWIDGWNDCYIRKDFRGDRPVMALNWVPKFFR